MQTASIPLLAISLAIATQASTPPSPPLCELSGVVIDASTGKSLPAISVIVLGTKQGANAWRNGEFHITDVPCGEHTISIATIATMPLSTTYQHQFVAGPDTVRRFPVLVEATRPATEADLVVGAGVSNSLGNLECTIRPVRHKFKVGEKPQFLVSIRNRGPRTVWLVRSQDGSADGWRYPRVSVKIAGPQGGFVVPGYGRCGNMNGLSPNDIVQVDPGKRFDPFAAGWWPEDMRGQFERPGRYVATFTYSSNEPDARRWMGWPSGGAGSYSDKLRSVTRAELTASVEFLVEE